VDPGGDGPPDLVADPVRGRAGGDEGAGGPGLLRHEGGEGEHVALLGRAHLQDHEKYISHRFEGMTRNESLTRMLSVINSLEIFD
jgi:hypothetical protein